MVFPEVEACSGWILPLRIAIPSVFLCGQQTWWPLSRPCPAMCGPKLDDYTESRVLRLRFQNAVPRLLQLYSDIRAGLLSEA